MRYLSRKRPGFEPEPATRLFCFPYAGGGASAYRRWQRGLDAHDAGVQVMPVQLPGREERYDEPRFTDLDALVDDLDAQLDEELAEPHIFYGHSMGALIAYSLARRRQARGAALPRALVLSSYRAPHLPSPALADPDAGDEDSSPAWPRSAASRRRCSAIPNSSPRSFRWSVTTSGCAWAASPRTSSHCGYRCTCSPDSRTASSPWTRCFPGGGTRGAAATCERCPADISSSDRTRAPFCVNSPP